jgi:alpha-glucosidase
MLTPRSYLSKLLIGVFSLYLILFSFCSSAVREVEIVSPNAQLKMKVNLQDSLSYSIFYKGKEFVKPSAIRMELSGQTLGVLPKIKAIRENTVNKAITPLYGKFATLQDHYNEVVISFEQHYSLILRAYDEGLAYRFVTDFHDETIVKDEVMELHLAGDPAAQYPETDNWTSWELTYAEYENTSLITKGKKAITPILFSYPDRTKLVVAEADVLSYPGMYLIKDDAGFRSTYAQYPDSTALGSWGFVSVVQRTRDYIAKTKGKRGYPWRVFILTNDDKTLLTNEIVYKLSEQQRIEDTSWIKPGKAVWEWWHDAMLPGANIPSGMKNRNTALYKFYVDFAAENKIEYLMIDAGWSHIFDLSQINPKVDVQEIIRYGKSKNVNVFLWCVAMALTDETADKYMQMIHDWGAVGLKVDFFDRDDQLTMDWYEQIAEKAAKYQLMIDYHGCSKPTGMQRAYPNIVNYEAVRGAECSKWDFTANPKHHLIFPFTRMLGGALDYTPGSMRNAAQDTFKPVDPGLPSTQGTRCHELAMYVIYDQYFAMLCDSPMEYRKYPDIMQFLSEVPVTFDDTQALDAKVGEYVLMAKRKGSNWYVGGMTNWDARTIDVDFTFLSPDIEYQATVIKDAPQADTEPTQYLCEEMKITNKTKLKLNMAKGGGFVISIHPILQLRAAV